MQIQRCDICGRLKDDNEYWGFRADDTDQERSPLIPDYTNEICQDCWGHMQALITKFVNELRSSWYVKFMEEKRSVLTKKGEKEVGADAKNNRG